MTGTVESKLAELGIALPTPAAPVANYVGFVRTGRLLMVSGQLCLGDDGKLVAQGKLGAELMKPPSRTTRATLSRSPSAALAWARRLMAQARAAFCPSSTETPAPSLPLATSWPPSPKQI